MAVLDVQEQEQVDALKAWWWANWKWLLVSLLLAAGGFAAVKGWQVYKAKEATDASTLYVELERQLASNDPKRINDAGQAVIDRYASSADAPRAALLTAQVNIQSHDLVRAKSQLEWVIGHVDEELKQSVALLERASVLLDEKHYAEALQLLDAKHPDSFNGLYADMRGDVLSAQGKTDEARIAYQLAFNKIDARSKYRNLIQIKLDALGGAK